MPRAKAAPRRTAPLARDEILSAALRVIDAEGLDALSMRRLARELSVEAMSLYHHVASKEALFDGIAASIVARMRFPEPAPDDWIEALVEMIDAFRRVLVAHPNAVPILLTRPLSPPEDAMTTPVSVLLSQGFDPERLEPLYASLMALTFGHALVLSVSGESPGAPRLSDQEFRQAARHLIAGFVQESEQPNATR